MKKAVLYARVSTALQEKEKTIESQVAELKKQISENGDVLVKEYVDNGYSGASLDRPALEQLRKDVETNLFDTVYFLSTDRIAREVTFQIIIIAEILKYKKQIIINGKDYVHNPENKFSLTILGAVSELERAKIVERTLRGKIHKLKQGHILNNGCTNLYGYTYIKPNGEKPAQLKINKKEAKTIKYIFEEYAKGISWGQLARNLEDMGIKRRNGKVYWDNVMLRSITANTAYSGIKYYNKVIHCKKNNNPMHKIKYGRKIYRDKSEWIGVKVPAIISKELFNKVQARREKNRQAFCKKKETQLLSGIIKCGNCGWHCIAYQRYYRYKKSNGSPGKIIHKIAYVCGRKYKNVAHSKKADMKICKNPEVSARLIEPCVFKIIQEKMLKPDELINCLKIDKKLSTKQKEIEKEIQDIDNEINKLNAEKKDLLNTYALGKISRAAYAKKCKVSDEETGRLQIKRNALIKSVPALHKREIIEVSVKHFCETTKTRFKQCCDPDSRRQFLLDYVSKIEYLEGKVTIYGSIPIQLKAYADPDQTSEASKIEFSIGGKIN